MAVCTLLLGKPGSGKTTSLHPFAADELGLVNVIGKPLPFRGGFRSTLVSDSYEKIQKALEQTAKQTIVVDDAGYLITNYFMAHHSSAGKGKGVFDLYNELGDQFWRFLEFLKGLDPAKTVYLIMHEERNDFGDVKPKTIGSLLDKQVCIEGMFTIVLRSLYRDGGYWFKTRTSGDDAVKTPMGMFEDDLIPNDLKAVDTAVRTYYGMTRSAA